MQRLIEKSNQLMEESRRLRARAEELRETISARDRKFAPQARIQGIQPDPLLLKSEHSEGKA